METLCYVSRSKALNTFPFDLKIVREVPVNKVTEEDLELIAYAFWCEHKHFGYYKQFCDGYIPQKQDYSIVGFENMPIVATGQRLIAQEQ